MTWSAKFPSETCGVGINCKVATARSPPRLTIQSWIGDAGRWYIHRSRKADTEPSIRSKPEGRNKAIVPFVGGALSSELPKQVREILGLLETGTKSCFVDELHLYQLFLQCFGISLIAKKKKFGNVLHCTRPFLRPITTGIVRN
jgi:hypothetical protein